MKKAPEARSKRSPGDKTLAKPSRLALLPLLRDFPAAARLLRDKEAPLWPKVLVVLAVVYVVWPADLVPDVVPVLSWVDDMGVVLVLRLLLHREIARYREPKPEPRTMGIDPDAISA